MRILRDYQQQAVEAVRSEWAGGTTRTAVVMATGLGKSTVIGKLATDEARAGGRALILAHRGELLSQLRDACRSIDPDVPIGHVQASRNEIRRPITVAMAPTLASEKRRARMLKPTMVIIDECHHAPSPSYMDILAWAGSFDHVRTLGVTATLIRGDKRGLGDVFESVAFTRDIAWAVENKWLARPFGRAVVAEHMDLSTLKVSKATRDYADRELGELVSQDADQIVKAWQSHAADRVTVAFVPSIAAAHDLRDQFLALGVAAEAVTGKTPMAERGDAAKGTGIYGRLARGETRVMVGVGVPTEGFDVPAISCVLMARPTKLPGLYAQMVGRGLRLHPGKADCLVLDVVGTSRIQKLVTLVDLSPSADYNTDELDALPCEVCGLAPCECEPEEKPERDPDGGRVRLLGPAQYEDVELFSSSSLNWLFTRAGIRFVPAKDRLVALWPEPDGSFSVGHCAGRGPAGGQWLGGLASRYEVPLTLDEAVAVAEAWASAYDPSTSARRASWRRGKPSPEQLDYARRLGVREPERMNRARISDEISIALASRRLDQVR